MKANLVTHFRHAPSITHVACRYCFTSPSYDIICLHMLMLDYTKQIQHKTENRSNEINYEIPWGSDISAAQFNR